MRPLLSLCPLCPVPPVGRQGLHGHVTHLRRAEARLRNVVTSVYMKLPPPVRGRGLFPEAPTC